MLSLSSARKDRLDQILSEAVTSKTTPALFLGVTNVDGPIYMHQTGRKLVDDASSEPINEDTVFWLCSQTKLITTIAALQLLEQGKIELDTPAEQVLPELANPVIIAGYDASGQVVTSPAKSKITFGQLLNHSSGLTYYEDGTFAAGGMPNAYVHSYKDQDVSDFFKIIKGSLPGVPLNFEPGTDFAYGFSSDCAGFIVERLSGKSLEEYFQEYIFAPLGLKSASFYLTPDRRERLLPLSFRNKDGSIERWKRPPVIDQEPAHVRVHLGGVGLYASQRDYLAILRHLLQIKFGRATNPILSLASVNLMFEPTLPPRGAASLSIFRSSVIKKLGLPAGSAQFSRGLLLTTADAPGKRKEGSGSWGGWANTSFFVDATSGIAVVLGTQLAPAYDEKYTQLYAQLETELYAGLTRRLNL